MCISQEVIKLYTDRADSRHAAMASERVLCRDLRDMARLLEHALHQNKPIAAYLIVSKMRDKLAHWEEALS